MGHCVAHETQTEEAHAEATGKPHASLRRPRSCCPCGSPGLRPPTPGHTHTAAMRGRPTMLEVGSTLMVERWGVGGVRTALASASFCSSCLRETKSYTAAPGAGLAMAQVFSCPIHSGFSPSLGAEGFLTGRG